MVSSQHITSNPAPGDYNIDSYSSIKHFNSSFKSSSKRTTFGHLSNDIPGPADYHPYEQTEETFTRKLLP